MRLWERGKPKRGGSEALDDPTWGDSEALDEPVVIPHGDLECENAVIEEHARFGRVRTALMRYLRGQYGDQVANRAMWRVSKRALMGSFTGDDAVEAEEKAMRPASRLRPITVLAQDQKEKNDLDKTKYL